MWPRKVFTIRRVTSPLFDFCRRITSPVNVNGAISDNAIRFVQCNDFTFHSSSSSPSSQSQQAVQQPQCSQIIDGTSPHFMHSSKSSLFMSASFLEATEAPLLFRVDQMDHPHCELGEAVSASQRSPKRVDVCDVHTRPRALEAHRQSVQMTR